MGNGFVTFTAKEANSTIGLNRIGTSQTLEYSTDAVNWNNFTTANTITLSNIDDVVYIRGILTGNNFITDYTHFKMTGKIAASGNCNALWDYNNLNAPLKEYCGNVLFGNCKSLTTAPELPATTLASNCYNSMFYGCSSLTTAPILPSTTLADSCYASMFGNCTSLTTAPKLPATTLVNNCYQDMFQYCPSLTTAPELPATTLTDSCYYGMFEGCSSLNYIKCLATDISAISCTQNWVNAVSSSGTFVKSPDISESTWGVSINGIPAGWNVIDYSEVQIDNYITLTALENNVPISLNSISSYQKLWYSTDGGGTWNNFTTGITITLENSGDVCYVAGILSGNNTSSNYTQFNLQNRVSVSGNINSLWNYTDLTQNLYQYCGYNLFNGCTGLIDVSGLSLGTSATTLADYCYYGIFRNCTSLTTSPVLPATTLANNCYFYMFDGCTSLTTEPVLPATTLASGCYQYMFQNCSSLTTAPELPSTALSNWCYAWMLKGCTSLTTAPELPATTLANNCYYGMFQGCTSLTTEPVLPATTLANGCYQYMFQNCSSLITSPELLATTLENYCYDSMFQGCSSLNYIKCLATDISAYSCTQDWVDGVATTGTFVKHPSVSWGIGTSGIPTNWTVIEGDEPVTPEDIANDIMQEVDIFAVPFNDLYETCLSVYLDMGYSVDDFDEVYEIIQSTPNLHDDVETFVVSNDSNEKVITVDNNGDFYLKGVGGYDGKNTKSEDSNIKPLQDVINEKQETLVAGDNIQINGNVISATGTTYTAGNNIQINDNVISATDTTYAASDFDIKDLADSTGLRSKWDNKQNALTAGNNIDITNNVITSKGYTYNNGTITTDGSVQVQNNLDIVSPTGGTPTLKLQRGSTDDSYTDFLIYGQSGNLKIDKSTSGTKTNMLNLNENGEVTVNGSEKITGKITATNAESHNLVYLGNELNLADVTNGNKLYLNYRNSTEAINEYIFCRGKGGSATEQRSDITCGNINTSESIRSNFKLFNVSSSSNNKYSSNINTVGWYKVAEIDGAVGVNGTLHIGTSFYNTRPESYIVNFAEGWNDKSYYLYAVNAVIIGNQNSARNNVLIDKIGFIKNTSSPYTLSIYIHYNTTVENNVFVALETGSANITGGGTRFYAPTYDSAITDASFTNIYSTKSGVNLKGFSNDFITAGNELNLSDVTSGNICYLNYRGSTNPINEYRFCKGVGNQSTYSDIRCGTLYQTSDITKKNVISDLDLDKAYDLIDKCQTIIYTLKDDERNKEQIGVIAQEIQEFFPEVVSADENGILAIDYSRLTVVIMKVLKDIIKRIQILEEKNNIYLD